MGMTAALSALPFAAVYAIAASVIATVCFVAVRHPRAGMTMSAAVIAAILFEGLPK